MKELGTKHSVAIQTAADGMAHKFQEAFSLFGRCHKGYNSSADMNDKQIDDLGKIDIDILFYLTIASLKQNVTSRLSGVLPAGVSSSHCAP